MSNTWEMTLDDEDPADSENGSEDGFGLQMATTGGDIDASIMENIFSKEDEIICRVIDLFPEVPIHRIHMIMGSVTTIYAEANQDNVGDAIAKVCDYLLENPDLLKEAIKEDTKSNVGNDDFESHEQRSFIEDTISVESHSISKDTKADTSQAFSRDTKSIIGRNFGDVAKSSIPKHTFSDDAKSSIPDHTFSDGAKSCIPGHSDGAISCIPSRTFSEDTNSASPGHTIIENARPSILVHDITEDAKPYGPSHILSEEAKSVSSPTLVENTESVLCHTLKENIKYKENYAFRENNKSIEDRRVRDDSKLNKFNTSSREKKLNVLRTPTEDTKYGEEHFTYDPNLLNYIGGLTIDPLIDSFPRQVVEHSSIKNENATSINHAEAIRDWYATFDKTEDKTDDIEEMNTSIAPRDTHCSCLWCFDDISSDETVHCESGHLFCRQCLEQYVRESVLRHGKLELKCVAADCDEVFPPSEVHRAIPEDLYNKYQERVMENRTGGVERIDTSVDREDTHYPCLCCFEDILFGEMIQCETGHLFCRQCLERYVKESVFGQGKLELKCVAADCGEVFPPSEVQRAIPDDLYNKYQERVMEEAVNCADLDNFVRCKTCAYGVVMDQEELFFMCPTCDVAYCRKCQRTYKDHQGVTCTEVEVKGETQIRTRYEEKMAEAKIRTCGRCKTRFTKDKGCNHIQCRCGASMCYVCRVPNVNKNKHYCRHVRESGGRCYQCDKSCYLYTDVNEDDEMAIAELKSEADYVRKMEGYTDDKEIGAPGFF